MKFKFYTSLFILLLSIKGIVFCQKSEPISIGAHLGPDAANLVSNLGFYMFLPEYTAGIDVNYELNDRFFIKGELNYIKRGYDIGDQSIYDDNGSRIATAGVKNYFNSINIPVFLGLNILNNGKLYVNAGGYLELLNKAHATYEYTYKKTSANFLFPSKTDITEKFNKQELGVSAGIGSNFYLKHKITFYSEFRTNLGITPAFKDDSPPRNIIFILYAGVKYKLKKK